MLRSHLLLACVALTVLLTGCASESDFQTGTTQTGKATWYGPGSQGTRTADGERFNMHDLTAAHRFLPFGSIVRVTNQMNGLSVVVRINDRGPFGYRSRIIDVSSAAADVLQMKQAGIIPVELEVLHLGPTHHHDDD